MVSLSSWASLGHSFQDQRRGRSPPNRRRASADAVAAGVERSPIVLKAAAVAAGVGQAQRP